MQQNHTFTMLLLAVCLSLAACSGLLESPLKIDRTFLLSPIEAPAGAITDSHEEALNLKLRVVPGLDTDRLVTVSGGAEMNHFSAVRWPDNLPEFSSSLIERSLRAHGWHTINPSRKASADESCELNLEIEKFYTLLDSSGQPLNVQIQWDGSYRCAAVSVPVRVSESVRIGQKEITGVVKAYQQGFELAMQSTLRQMELAGSD